MAIGKVKYFKVLSANRMNQTIRPSKIGTVKNSENKTVYKGTFEVPNLSEENDVKDVDVIINQIYFLIY